MGLSGGSNHKIHEKCICWYMAYSMFSEYELLLFCIYYCRFKHFQYLSLWPSSVQSLCILLLYYHLQQHLVYDRPSIRFVEVKRPHVCLFICIHACIHSFWKRTILNLPRIPPKCAISIAWLQNSTMTRTQGTAHSPPLLSHGDFIGRKLFILRRH